MSGENNEAMSLPRYQLVVQWPAPPMGLRRLVKFEDALLASGLDVDGHDYGSGTGNIFIFVSSPQQAFEQMRPTLERLGAMAGARIAYRKLDEDDYVILWPAGLSEFKLM